MGSMIQFCMDTSAYVDADERLGLLAIQDDAMLIGKSEKSLRFQFRSGSDARVAIGHAIWNRGCVGVVVYEMVSQLSFHCVEQRGKIEDVPDYHAVCDLGKTLHRPSARPWSLL